MRTQTIKLQEQEVTEMIRVDLDDRDLNLCSLITQLRMVTNKKTGAQDMLGSTKQGEEFKGMIGEYAFGKYFNIFPDLTLQRKDSHANVDYITNEGVIIDVKTTSKGSGAMNVNASKVDGKKRKPDIYVCVEADQTIIPPVLTLIGWVKYSDFKEHAEKKQGRSEYYALDLKHLKPKFPASIFGEGMIWKRKSKY